MEFKLLALDVEGTIIPGYHYTDVRENGDFPAKIAPELTDLLKKFHEHNFHIVLATGTDSDNLKYYRDEFTLAGFIQYISAFKPNEHSADDSKENKLAKYQNQYSIDQNDIYYFDDAPNNVSRAKEAGFAKSYQVSDERPLHMLLLTLAKKLDIYNEIKNDERSPLLGPQHGSDEQEKTGCCCRLM